MRSADWPHVRLGDLIQVKHGWAFKGELFSEELSGLPIVVNIGNFEYTGGFRFERSTIREYRGPYPPEYELQPMDILLVMTCQTAGGEILGVPGRIPDDGRVYLHNQRLGKVEVITDDSVDEGWLYWLFLSPEFNRELAVTATGTKILHTSPGRIHNFRLSLPPFKEQHAIASILGALDDKIELNRRMNQTLEAMAQALFKSWFVDFDPVRVKAEGRQPSSMDAETAALFPDSFEDLALGEIPRGWGVGTLGETAHNPRRGINPGSLAPDTPYIGLEHMPRRSIALADWGSASDVASTKTSFFLGEILFGKLRPYFHKVGLAPVNGVCSTDILVVVPKESLWLGFVLGHLSSDDLIAHTSAHMDGTKMPRVGWKDLASYAVTIPSIAIAEAFTTRIAPMLELIWRNGEQGRTLASIRDALLPKLLSGEIRVGEAERAVEAVT